MNKISGKELNLLKTLEILKSNRFVSFYHFNNLSKREWDTIKLQLRKIETQDIPSNESQGVDKEKKGKTQVLPLSNLLLERTALVQSKSNLLLKQVASNSNKLLKGVTTKRKLKGAEVELLVLKSKAVVKALYPFLFYSHRYQGVEQTVDTYPLSLLHGVVRDRDRAKHHGHQVAKTAKAAAQNTGDPLSTNVVTPLLRFSRPGAKGHVAQHLKQVVSNVSDPLLPEKSGTTTTTTCCACYAREGRKSREAISKAISKAISQPISKANNQLGFTLNPMPAARINSLINAFYLIEGPTLLVGASTTEGFKESARQLEKEKSLVFVGGVLENQFINHLDLKDCLKTFLPTSANLLQTLNYALMISPLNYYSNKLLFLLQKRQESLKKKKV